MGTFQNRTEIQVHHKKHTPPQHSDARTAVLALSAAVPLSSHFLVNRVDHCPIVSPSDISTRSTQQDSLADSYTTATAARHYELEFH